MSPEKHLTRKRLIEIARAGTPPSDSHLAACDVCREAYEMLSRYYSLIGRPPLPAPPADFLRRARSIAREGAPSGARLVEVAARLVFDSWAAPAAVGVRGPAVENDRRLHFEAAGVAVELRVEQKETGWSCIAQCVGTSDRFVIETDAEVVYPDDLGVCQWRAPRPPARLVVHTAATRVIVSRLQWKRTRRT